MTHDLACQELVELVTDYLEDKLLPEAKTDFEQHFMRCSGCRNYLAQMRQTIQVTGHLTETALSPTMQTELLELFQDWKREGGMPRKASL